jgi:hypothetical protein
MTWKETNNHQPLHKKVYQDHLAQLLALLFSNSEAAVRTTECVLRHPHGGTLSIAAGTRQ